MKATLDAVFVERGRGRTEERVFLCAQGDGPSDLPSRGGIGGHISPIDLTSLSLVACLIGDDSPAWPDSRIAEELASFLEARTLWPSNQHFIHEGRGPLLRQIERTGGAPRWARELGIAGVRVAHNHWTEVRIRATLGFVLRERSEMPTHRELAGLGYSGLSAAMRWRGREYWAHEFSVRYHARGKGNGR